MVREVLKQSVGMDVSKDSFSACFTQREIKKELRILSSRKFACNIKGFREFEKWFTHLHREGVPLYFLMEATGVYYEELAYFLFNQGEKVSILLPNKTSAYAKSLDYKSKTDEIDAKKLAQMSLERDLPLWSPPSDKMLKIKRLCRERDEILQEKTAVSNRLHAKDHSYQPEKESLKRAEKLLNFLEKQVKQIEKAIHSTIENDAEIKQKIEIVCSIPGISMISAATIVSETNGFTLFKNKAQLVSYAGYDVVEKSSGTSVKGVSRISKKGNKHIRKILYFPAIVATMHDPKMKALYLKVFDRTKIKMKGFVAVQRKLLVLIYTLYKKNEAFNPDFKPHSPSLTKQAGTKSLPLVSKVK